MLLGGSESDIEVLPLGSRTPARSVSVACLLTRSGEAKRRPRGWGTTEEAEAKQDGGERGGRGDKGRFAASEVAKSFCAREVPSLCSSPSHSSSANRARSASDDGDSSSPSLSGGGSGRRRWTSSIARLTSHPSCAGATTSEKLLTR